MTREDLYYDEFFEHWELSSKEMDEFENTVYSQALDDFLKKIEEHQQENWIDNLEYGITFTDLEEVAEQLKEKK